MLKILGDKMDKLEEYGVLAKPDDVGVVPEFVVPSMLRPKEEPGEWRLVTDFSPLNVHIKKLQTVTPTIQESKRKLAKAKYHIQLDLSNYFYQAGVRRSDSQYLGTPHPFKGLRVYICEPQGLKNSSEHAYERLQRVYGDLCAADKMAQQADAVFVLGNTLEQLSENFREVLNRARLSNLTFKPSKVIIVPEKSILWGWKKENGGWSPTAHTISPLSIAVKPTTIKQMRSFLGSYKQLTDNIPRYAQYISIFDELIGNRASAEKIIWTEDLEEAFEKAKKSLNTILIVHTPRPDDKLHTYSDYSEENKCIGGRLEIHRKDEGGKVTKLSESQSPSTKMVAM